MKLIIFFLSALFFELAVCERSWESGVKSCCDGAGDVMRKFPDPMKTPGENVLALFIAQVDNLKELTNSTTEIFSTSATSILDVLSLLKDVGQSPDNILQQLKKTLLRQTSVYCNVVTSLDEFIGDLDLPINDVVTDVRDGITTVLRQFYRRPSQRKQDRCQKIDFKKMVVELRFNANTIAFIADTAVNNDGKISDDAFAALVVVTLIANLQLVTVHGTNTNIGTVLHSETTSVSPCLEKYLDALDPLGDKITKLITSASFDNLKGWKQYLGNYAKTIFAYNPSLEKVIGPFKGVKLTKAEVLQDLQKSK